MAAELEDDVEERLVVLESRVQHLQSDVSEIKAEARQFRSEMLARFDKVDARFEKVDARLDKLTDLVYQQGQQMIRGDLQTRIWMLVLTGTVLAVMARGFKWI